MLSAGDWRSWGRDLASWRFQSDPGFSAAQVPQLKLRWTFAYPGRAAFNQPAVAGDLVLPGSTGGRVFALAARTSCTRWSSDAGASSLTRFPPLAARSIPPGSSLGSVMTKARSTPST